MKEQVMVPDVGEAENVEVVEVLVAVGDEISANDSVVVLESDKASMEIPSPVGGVVASIAVSEGDTVEEGSLLIEIEAAASEDSTKSDAKQAESEPSDEAPAADDSTADGNDATNDQAAEASAAASTSSVSKIETSHIIPVPDVGDVDEVTVVEVLIERGAEVAEGDSLVVLESDKASMEIPADFAGVVQEIFVDEGDTVKEGDPLVTVVGRVEADAEDASPTAAADGIEAEETAGEQSTGSQSGNEADARDPEPKKSAPEPERKQTSPTSKQSAGVHAGPAVRKQAREYGVELAEVKGSGRRGRILKEDIQTFVKSRMSGAATASGSGIPSIPQQDFSKHGEIEKLPLSRIRRASAKNLHRSWLNVPHVTQFDEADITDLELFRKSQNQELQQRGQKVTPLAFLVRAVVDALIRFPRFNSSIASDYDHLVLKKYYNIGIAVETDDGLMVPVLKDADKKGVIQIAEETAALANDAREGKLALDAMQGATFTISSLGGIGGTAFTPIVNAPEVAILGVSRSKVAPVYNGQSFEPRTLLPLSLSYDHRAIDGAEAARFTTHLASVLTDMRRVIM